MTPLSLVHNFPQQYLRLLSTMLLSPPRSSTVAAAAIFIILSPLLATACSPKPRSPVPCPPFTTPPPYPFSTSPGCGHPFFQINCSSPYSTISINHLSFSLLHFDPNSSSLLLSPSFNSSPHSNCSSPKLSSIPDRSITLSGSPFRASDGLCSRLSALRPCPPPNGPNLPNCSHCSWQCKLIKNPLQLLRDCGSTCRPVTEQGCQADVLDFMNNLLQMGFGVDWDLSQDSHFTMCRACRANNGVCGFNASEPNKQFLCFHSESQISPPWIHRHGPDHGEVLGLIFAVSCLLLFVSVAVAIFRSRRFKPSEEEDPTAIFLRHRSNLLPPVFTFEELESSTGKFDPNRKIGDGGFGSVFLGHLSDGRSVAVKYLHKHQAATARAFSAKSFCNEIMILSLIDHPNLVKLHGYCRDPRGLLLVYDYVPNGTLADHLHHRRRPLSWSVRLDMALQIALALEYLHFSVTPSVVHRDITSSNIFVEGDMRIKVGDFGLSRLLVFPDKTTSSSGFVWTGPQGTPGYLDPDYHRSFRLTEKSDVYSFGVVLLELISGLRAVDQSREKREMALADFAVSKIQTGLLHQVVDPTMASVEGSAMDSISAVAELAFQCVAADKDDRPDSREIVEELKRIRSCTR